MPRRLKHRSKVEILSSTTQIYTGTTMARIQYEIYVSYKQLKDYLTLLVQYKLIEFVREEQIFRITESGINALNIFDEMNKLLVLQLTEYSVK
jgi:predicted transcriptional regulator